MNKMDKMLVGNHVHDIFYRFMDSSDALLIVNCILDDVIQDIEECADGEFYTTQNIDNAVTRVLKKRIGIEE